MGAESDADKGHRPSPDGPAGEHIGVDVLWLCVGLLVPVAALMLVVIDGERVALWFMPDHPFPHVCWTRRLFGWNCPFCGLTRSTIYLCHGNVASSLAVHRLGWLAFAALAGQIPYRTARLLKSSSAGRTPGTAWERWLWGGLVVLMVANWMLEVLSECLPA